MIRGLAALALALLLAGPAPSQEAAPDPVAEALVILDGLGRESGADVDALPTLPQGLVLDAAAAEAMQRAVQAYYEYNRQGFDHRKKVFAWQHLSTRLIFGAVMLIVAVGLYFSWMQFHASDRGRDLGVSSVEGSAEGFKLSSPVLGVVILALSLGFFYLYLVHVYPIVDAI